MSFYQSDIRQTIQEVIYQKPIFSIKLFGKDYFGTIKTKKIGPVTLKRYQILGIEIPSDPEQIRHAIQTIKHNFKSSSKNIFFQLGITNQIVSFNIKDFVSDEFAKDLREGRTFLRNYHQKHYSLNHSFRENMPESGIIYDLTKPDNELLAEMNKASKDRIKKGIKENIRFGAIKESEYQTFYTKRQATAGKKGFNIIPYDQYQRLIKYLIETGKGNLFVTKHNDEILAGAVCVFYNKTIVCLYSFADRTHNTMGGQQYMKFKIFGRGRDNGYRICDMMGGAPTGFPEHELASLSAFKESMGGTKIEYYGNYDIVLHPRLYKFFKFRYQIKK